MRAARALLLAAFLQVSGYAWGLDDEHCGAGRVELEASTATATDLRLVCEGVSFGVEFLRSRGVDFDSLLHVKVVDALPSQHGVPSLGQFDPKRMEIRVLSLTNFLAACKDDPPFPCPTTAEVYRSFVVHEVIHAVTHAALAGRAVRRLQMEYLAYVAQLASLPDELREELIETSGVEGFEREEEMSAFFYFSNPNLYGIKAYMHYRRPETGDAYLRKILGTR